MEKQGKVQPRCTGSCEKPKRLLELELLDKKEIQHPLPIAKWMHNRERTLTLFSTSLSEMHLDDKIRHLYPRHCSEHMPWIARGAQNIDQVVFATGL